MLDLWSGQSHFVLNQNPAPVPSVGHREAFVVYRFDISTSTIYLYHRCFNNGLPEICLSVSNDNGQSFPIQYGVIISTEYGYFSVAPSVINNNGLWIMVYEEGGSTKGTYWATSTNGINWTKQGSLFSENVYRATPGIYKSQGNIYVFSAEHIDADSLGIIFHSGPNMTNLVQWGGGYVLTGTEDWEHGSVSMPRIFYDNQFHWMSYEGGTQNLNCGYGSSEQNMYGWGIARSTNLTSWEKYVGNPIMQGLDIESCGYDMPQPFRHTGTGEIFVYYTSDNTGLVLRDKLSFGSACSYWQTYPNWKEKNHICMPSCGGIGGTACYQTKDCQSGTKVGISWDCVSCCR